MIQPLEIDIQRLEDRLKQAMLVSDVSTLDELLAPDLIFTNHLGQLMTKQDDLQAHQSGVLKIKDISLSDQKIKIIGDVAVVTVRAHIIGSFAGEVSESDFRFTRMWSETSNDNWQLVVAHSCIVV